MGNFFARGNFIMDWFQVSRVAQNIYTYPEIAIILFPFFFVVVFFSSFFLCVCNFIIVNFFFF